MTASAPELIPAPRPAAESPRSAPFRLPQSCTRTACRPVIGDALLLQYPEVAKALAAGSCSGAAEALAARVRPLIAGALSAAEICHQTGIGWKIIGGVVAAKDGGTPK